MKKLIFSLLLFASGSLLSNCCIDPSPRHCTYSLAYKDQINKANQKDSKRIFYLVDPTGLKVKDSAGKTIECKMGINDALPGPTCPQCPKCKHDMATHVCDKKSNIIDPQELK